VGKNLTKDQEKNYIYPGKTLVRRSKKMARKLLYMVALISLVLVAQASASLATTYNFTGDKVNIEWKHLYSDKHPWDANTEFNAGAPLYYSLPNEAVWKIGLHDGSIAKPFTNTDPGVLNPDGSYTIVFNQTSANPGFFFKLPDNTIISSTDTVITYNVKYVNNTGNHYTITDGQIIAAGTNDFDLNHTPFQFVGYLNDMEGNHVTNNGYFSSYSVTYPAAAQTPIPGAVWLLGTGLLGLACVGRRRRA
jgi:hypothetical protein